MSFLKNRIRAIEKKIKEKLEPDEPIQIIVRKEGDPLPEGWDPDIVITGHKNKDENPY